MADAGCILPVYHGNEAETDFKPVGDVDEMLIFPHFVPAPGKFALARMLQMQLRPCQAIGIER
jgi:hypothetical protein